MLFSGLYGAPNAQNSRQPMAVNQSISLLVIPAKAGTQWQLAVPQSRLGSRFRGNDEGLGA